ncbi:MAG: aminoglycoside phosphotransferase family protein [Chloroflexota bacterium]|nr:aminoglycoside phosphotransferase family protein [Chloroflexota bacterium]
MEPPDTQPFIELPETYRAMPRWWHHESKWLDRLPETVRTLCERWSLTRDGPVRHGSNAIAVPVRRHGEPLVLRVTPPDARTADEVRALRFWAGRGTVRLLDADPANGASLLERLDGERTLAWLPLDEAVPIIGRMMRRLALPAPPDVPSTASIVRERATTLEPQWERLGRPFSRRILNAGVEAASDLGQSSSSLAVNGDLHFEQVLAGTREPWLVVDPVLLRGDIEYDLARILWSRLDEIGTDTDILRHVGTVVHEAGLEYDRALAWIVYRTVDYWLWGLDYGLTEDPVRYARLVGAVVPSPRNAV